MQIPINHIDNSWTLFLDRDGVINHEKHKDYIHTWDEFVFYDGVHQAIETFSKIFHRIIIVTNQKGVGKGLTKIEDLLQIHNNMKASIQEAGGRIDAIYFCSDLDDNSHNRKPNPGMGFQAKNDFPDIDFSKTIMVGNTLSDMEFGKKLAMHTVFITSKHEPVSLPHDWIDEQHSSLFAWSESLMPAEMLN